jgi:hypothetical protein
VKFNAVGAAGEDARKSAGGATTGPVVVTTASGVLTSNVNFRITK